SAGIDSSDQGAHTGAGDHVHRYAILLQPFDHADVRQAERATAFEHKADPRPVAGGRRCHGVGWWLGDAARSVLRPKTRHEHHHHANSETTKVHCASLSLLFSVIASLIFYCASKAARNLKMPC